MPKLQSFRDFHYDATAKVSENTRTFALAAIAIVWLFRGESGPNYVVPQELQLPLFLVLLSLALDFLQHFYRSAVWHGIFRAKERQLEEGTINENDELYVSPWVNRPAYLCFYLKVASLLVSYILILNFFLSNISWE